MKLTNKQRVKRRYPSAGCGYSAMRGYEIISYADQYAPSRIAYSTRSEGDAWRNAARKLRPTRKSA